MDKSAQPKFDYYRVSLPMFALEDVAKTLISTDRCMFRSAISLDWLIQGQVDMIRNQLTRVPPALKGQKGYKRAQRSLDDAAKLIHAVSSDEELYVPRCTGYALKGLLMEIQTSLMEAAEAVKGRPGIDNDIKTDGFDFDIK